MSDKIVNLIFNNNHSYDNEKIESPIEQILLNHLIKFLHPETEVIVQFPIKTISGNFRGDIALIRGEIKVILECDGEEFHSAEKDDWYDEWRDTLILIQNKVNTIYRIKGKDIYSNIYSVIYIIYFFDPELFNEEFSSRLKKWDIEEYMYIKYINYEINYENGKSSRSKTEVKRKNTLNGFDVFWLNYVMYSLLYPDKNIYQLIDLMSSAFIDEKILVQRLNEKYPNLNILKAKNLLNIFK